MTKEVLSFLTNLLPLILLSSALILLIIGMIQPHILKVEQVIWPDHASHKSSDKPDPDALRILLISDLHAEHIFISIDRVCSAIRAASPDVLLFAGDWTASVRPRALSRMDSWLNSLSETAKELGIPFLVVPGNHDKDEIKLKLQHSGCGLLINKTRIVNSKTGRLWQIAGLDDLREGSPAIPEFDHRIPVSSRVILAHNPDLFLHVNADQAKYFLSGHFHGGQIWAPFNLEFFLFRDEKMAKMGYHRGDFVLDGKLGYISRGLGCVLLPFRLFSLPELTIIDIDPEGSDS